MSVINLNSNSWHRISISFPQTSGCQSNGFDYGNGGGAFEVQRIEQCGNSLQLYLRTNTDMLANCEYELTRCVGSQHVPAAARLLEQSEGHLLVPFRTRFGVQAVTQVLQHLNLMPSPVFPVQPVNTLLGPTLISTPVIANSNQAAASLVDSSQLPSAVTPAALTPSLLNISSKPNVAENGAIYSIPSSSVRPAYLSGSISTSIATLSSVNQMQTVAKSGGSRNFTDSTSVSASSVPSSTMHAVRTATSMSQCASMQSQQPTTVNATANGVQQSELIQSMETIPVGSIIPVPSVGSATMNESASDHLKLLLEETVSSVAQGSLVPQTTPRKPSKVLSVAPTTCTVSTQGYSSVSVSTACATVPVTSSSSKKSEAAESAKIASSSSAAAIPLANLTSVHEFFATPDGVKALESVAKGAMVLAVPNPARSGAHLLFTSEPTPTTAPITPGAAAATEVPQLVAPLPSTLRHSKSLTSVSSESPTMPSITVPINCVAQKGLPSPAVMNASLVPTPGGGAYVSLPSHNQILIAPTSSAADSTISPACAPQFSTPSTSSQSIRILPYSSTESTIPQQASISQGYQFIPTSCNTLVPAGVVALTPAMANSSNSSFVRLVSPMSTPNTLGLSILNTAIHEPARVIPHVPATYPQTSTSISGTDTSLRFMSQRHPNIGITSNSNASISTGSFQPQTVYSAAPLGPGQHFSTVHSVEYSGEVTLPPATTVTTSTFSCEESTAGIASVDSNNVFTFMDEQGQNCSLLLSSISPSTTPPSHSKASHEGVDSIGYFSSSMYGSGEDGGPQSAESHQSQKTCNGGMMSSALQLNTTSQPRTNTAVLHLNTTSDGGSPNEANHGIDVFLSESDVGGEHPLLDWKGFDEVMDFDKSDSSAYLDAQSAPPHTNAVFSLAPKKRRRVQQHHQQQPSSDDTIFNVMYDTSGERDKNTAASHNHLNGQHFFSDAFPVDLDSDLGSEHSMHRQHREVFECNANSLHQHPQTLSASYQQRKRPSLSLSTTDVGGNTYPNTYALIKHEPKVEHIGLLQMSSSSQNFHHSQSDDVKVPCLEDVSQFLEMTSTTFNSRGDHLATNYMLPGGMPLLNEDDNLDDIVVTHYEEDMNREMMQQHSSQQSLQSEEHKSHEMQQYYFLDAPHESPTMFHHNLDIKPSLRNLPSESAVLSQSNGYQQASHGFGSQAYSNNQTSVVKSEMFICSDEMGGNSVAPSSLNRSNKPQAAATSNTNCGANGSKVCPICGTESFRRYQQLIEHCRDEHQLHDMQVLQLEFPSKQEFLQWKSMQETATAATFVQRCGANNMKDTVNSYYTCHLSGSCSQESPTKKGAACPAFMRVSRNKSTGNVTLTYCLKHLGHA